MGTELPKTQESSGETDSNSHSDSEKSDSSSSSSSGSSWGGGGGEGAGGGRPARGARKPHFSVTSCDTGLKLKIAAVPATSKALSDSSSSASCSKCSSESSSDDDLPLRAVTQAAAAKRLRREAADKKKNEKGASGEERGGGGGGGRVTGNAAAKRAEQPRRGRGRPSTKLSATPVGAEAGVGAGAASSSSSSSSSGSSSSDSDTASTADTHASNDSSAALAAACSLQVIDEEDLAALLPEQPAPAVVAFPPYPSHVAHAAPPPPSDKSVQDTGDGSSSEMELPPQLVSAAIQRATADSSESENECSNAAVSHQSGGHYASSLLQQFVAQTQLLSHSTSGGASARAVNDCVLGQINALPEINPIAPAFLTTEHLESDHHQHLSPQQTEELSQINKDLDLEEITSAGISSPNPPTLDDCVDNNVFLNLDIASNGLGVATDLLKSSPIGEIGSDVTQTIDVHKLDTVSTNSIESQEDTKQIVPEVRKKRGRPRKVREEPSASSRHESVPTESHREEKCVNNMVNDFCHNDDPPNVSPDSGILSNHNSPTHSPLRRPDLDVSGHRAQNKSPLKENRHKEKEKRSSRSKSKNRTRNRTNSDSSECDYRDRVVEVRKIKTEAPSPVPLKHEPTKSEKTKKPDHKLDIAALDRMLYATDRVLYPPRRKNNRLQNKNVKRIVRPTSKDKSQTDSGDSDVEARANRSVLSEVYAKRKDLNNKLASLPKKGTTKGSNTSWRDHQSEAEGPAEDPLDPTWRQIDLNPKYKDILSGYKSDHEIKPYKSCSRLMESGYKSDYGCRSGYRSDCFRSGYKSDHKSGYKSDKSGYKTDHSVRNIRRRMRKLKKSRSVRDRTYYKNQKHFVSDQEIIMLANKTFSCLTLGQSTSDSESEMYPRKVCSSPKFVSVSLKFPSLTPTLGFGFSSLSKKKLTKPKVNTNDPFAPGPVFSALGNQSTNFASVNIFKTSTNNNSLVKTSHKSNFIGKPLPANKIAFTHKFGCSPIAIASKLMGVNTKRNMSLNNNTLKQVTRNVSPKNRKTYRNPESDTSPKQVASIFEKAKNSYIPNKTLSRNVFLNFKKPSRSLGLHIKKHKRPVVIAPPKIHLKPTERVSRISLKMESRHHRHKSRRSHRSRSASRCRDRDSVDTVDQKFTQEMDSLTGNFIKLCQIAPKVLEKQQVTKNTEKTTTENSKCVKRVSKKRKTSDNTEAPVPTTKRRHKKQMVESQAKGGKEAPTANEHKLPLKKRHYHINSSTSNTLSLSLVSSEFDENSKLENTQDTFLCTESNCMGDLKTTGNDNAIKAKSLNDKHKKICDVAKVVGQLSSVSPLATETNPEDVLKSIKSGINTTVESLTVQIDEAIEACKSQYTSPTSSHATDDELSIKKPIGEHSELSKKIYETSEKLKAVHKMVHDLEKSLPKTKESEIKTDPKIDSHKVSSPKPDSKLSLPTTTTRNSAPIVTPKKRHRLENDKLISNSSLDHVVQSLSKKLSEDKVASDGAKTSAPPTPTRITEENSNEKSSSNSPSIQSNDSSSSADPLKSMSARTLCKSAIPPAQKSEIMTRKKNRLEGLTSNLVSKINPSTATKMLDTLLNNNIRKSIESRIMEKDKTNTEPTAKAVDDKCKSKETSHMNTRATVIKSPISKGKLPSEAKKLPKGTEILLEQTVVVNVDQPTGIFEPSVDLELQIPKSSISLNNVSVHRSDSNKSKVKLRSSDNKGTAKSAKQTLDIEVDIPLSLMTETTHTILNRPKRSDSIASVISDKIQETASVHNLRQSKRNLATDNEKLSEDANEKKKKKVGSSIIRESKLLLPHMMQPKVQAEKMILDLPEKKKPASETPAPKAVVTASSENSEDSTIKRKPKRRQINRTGFPSVKKKKKKLSISLANSTDTQTDQSATSDNNSAFERVPKEGEATTTFLERTTAKKANELKVILNKEDCPKQGRLSVISLERLQGKELLENNNVTHKKPNIVNLNNEKVTTNLPSPQLRNKTDKDPTLVNKWEVLSETDSIPSLSVSSFGNDPEDSIPLSLLNLKPERPSSQMDRVERLKRKTRETSPSQEVEDIISSKRKSIDGKANKARVRPKSSLAMLYPSERRSTRSTEAAAENNEKQKIVQKKAPAQTIANVNITKEPEVPQPDRIVARRKSRSCQTKKSRAATPSSRDSSMDTVRGVKLSPKSSDAGADTKRDHCFENDPLPLNEKEIDFEKSIDVLSKSVICKKRVASSRDDSPASGSDRERPTVSKRNPRLRKKFLIAGLFSDFYKENDPKPMDAKAKGQLRECDAPRGLLAPPPYCERWVRQRRQSFALPYDIWWQRRHNQAVPSWNYKKIRSNVYYDVKPSADECESVACNCTPSSGCPEDCINRLVYAECSPRLCPCRERCKNQRIQKHEWAPGIERFMTEHKGWGVRCGERIACGDFILEYVGEVVSDKEFKERMASRYARDTHHYCLHLDGGLVIDGHRMGGEGRFVNHSCRPNCEMQKWTANGTFRMALFALRDICPGEELTYDYNFSLFNPAEGQPCKCGSDDCRGVIGGKSQRVARPRAPAASAAPPAPPAPPLNRVGRPRKPAAGSRKSDAPRALSASVCDAKCRQQLRLWREPAPRALGARERAIVRERHCFLLRSLEKVRKQRERASPPPAPPPAPAAPAAPLAAAPSPAPPDTHINPLSLPTNLNALANININPSVFLTRLQALRTPKNTKTRRLAEAEDDPQLGRRVRLNNVFRSIYSLLLNLKDENDESVCAPLLRVSVERGAGGGAAAEGEVASRQLAGVGRAAAAAAYGGAAQFDADVGGLLAALVKHCGRNTPLGAAALYLRKVYNSSKLEFAEQLKEILGPEEPLPPSFLQKSKPEEVIMCICGLHLEEGLMVQCGGARCGVWQHARCMQLTDTSAPHLCHKCLPRPVDLEIPLDEYTEEGHRFYLSLMRGALQVRQGDTVYVLRDIPVDAEHPDVSGAAVGGAGPPAPAARRADRKARAKGKERDRDKEDDKKGDKSEVPKHTYKSIGEIPVSELDIFRVERLWRHRDTGERFVYGHHYLRPHETYHEPTRKFFPNEVMRVPLYEAVPIDLVMSQCWVMDVNTYCKGRPISAAEEHVYICELRVDRTAHLFTKVSRPKYPICTKSYAFTHFPQRLKISRTYAPHEVLPEYLKGRGGGGRVGSGGAGAAGGTDRGKKPTLPALPPPAPPATTANNNKSRERQKERLNAIVSRLQGGAAAAGAAPPPTPALPRRRSSALPRS